MRKLTDLAILKEIGKRIKNRRIHKKLTQHELAVVSGLNINTIQSIEYGKPVTTLSLIQTMRGLRILDQLDNFLLEIGPSPIEMMKRREKQVQRVRRTNR